MPVLVFIFGATSPLLCPVTAEHFSIMPGQTWRDTGHKGPMPGVSSTF